MTETTRELTVYVLARTDLPSMNPGKMAAQVHHAGVQMMVKHELHILVQEYVVQGCAQGADSFNTTIVLGATHQQLWECVDQARGKLKSDVVYDVVTDPSYPFFVENTEIANLIPQTDTTKIIKTMDDGPVLMVRPEVTVAWFLGDRNNDNFRNIFLGLRLHP